MLSHKLYLLRYAPLSRALFMTAFLFVFVVAVDAVVVGTLPQSLQIQLLLPFHSFHSFNFAKSHKIDISFRKLADIHHMTGQAERNKGSTLENSQKIDISFRSLTVRNNMTGQLRKYGLQSLILLSSIFQYKSRKC